MHHQQQWNKSLSVSSKTRKRSSNVNAVEEDDVHDDEDEEGEGDSEAWETLNKTIRRVQSVLDQNRVLIQQVNENQQSKIPDNLVKNVALIREINGNISKVISLYSDISSDFTNVVHQRRGLISSSKNGSNSSSADNNNTGGESSES
ncbi:Protein EARLY FLOWERING 4 domain [Dillenia turbinata]|uniref:Protein EARLY FLOWERING 4 domain n=1 Tax=Dillenia turbinata TaxID=194707 RepID=A0AAN8VX15_9MAGN